MPSGKGGSSKGGARSLGAAKGNTSPSGAILDDTDEVLLQRKQRFKAWAKGFRETKLKPAAFENLYPQPVKWKG
jgi:hypothetical protein